MVSKQFLELSAVHISQLKNDFLPNHLPRLAELWNLATICLKTFRNDGISYKIFAYDYENIQNGTDPFLVALIDKTKGAKLKDQFLTWTVFAPEAKYLTSDMMEALASIVDWKRENHFCSLHPDLSPLFEKMSKHHGGIQDKGHIVTMYAFVDVDESSSPDLISMNGNVTTSELSLDGLKNLMHYWEYANTETFESVWLSAQNMGSAGVIVDGELVSWAYISPGGGVRALYTLEEHRGKGYAKKVLRALGRTLKKKGMYLISGVAENNVASAKLMLASGFKAIQPETRICHVPMPTQDLDNKAKPK